jgi:hypothetical protein
MFLSFVFFFSLNQKIHFFRVRIIFSSYNLAPTFWLLVLIAQ